MSPMFEYLTVVGVSTASIEDAIKQAITEVARTRSIGWFEVAEVRGRLKDTANELEYQVTVKCGCKSLQS